MKTKEVLFTSTAVAPALFDFLKAVNVFSGIPPLYKQ